MIGPLDILSTIRRAGGRVVVEDQDLRIVAPPGTVTPEALLVLQQHKAGLISILPDSEREAIQWAENLTPNEAAEVLQLARQWDDQDQQVHDQHEDQQHDQDLDEEDLDTWEAAEEPIPCDLCGSLMAWWDLNGKRHCEDCDPPTLARSLRDCLVGTPAEVQRKLRARRIRLQRERART